MFRQHGSVSRRWHLNWLQIQLLVMVSTMKLTTLDRLNRWEKQYNRCWVAELQSIAKSGLSWADAGEQFGIPSNRLKAFCCRRGLSFPWQGHRSPVQREHQRRMTLDNPGSGRPPVLYRYRGMDYSLVELSRLSSLPVTTIRFRLARKWSIEDAVETRKYTRSEVARMSLRASRSQYVEA